MNFKELTITLIFGQQMAAVTSNVTILLNNFFFYLTLARAIDTAKFLIIIYIYLTFVRAIDAANTVIKRRFDVIEKSGNKKYGGRICSCCHADACVHTYCTPPPVPQARMNQYEGESFLAKAMKFILIANIIYYL